MEAGSKPRVGISACLAGRNVRYDGANKYDESLISALEKVAEPVLFCPEMEIGLGAPRDPLRLYGDPQNPRALSIGTGGADVTDKLEAAGGDFVRKSGICGFIGKGRSPSCGHKSAEVYDNEGGLTSQAGSGVFVNSISRTAPDMPVEEAESLCGKTAFDRFMERVVEYSSLHGERGAGA